MQNIFLPMDSAGRIDEVGQVNAGILMKQLLCYSSNLCLWAVTGSSMALFWVHLARMAPNGTCALLRCHPINLPGRHNESLRRWALPRILQRYPNLRDLPLSALEGLVEWSESLAVLSYSIAEAKLAKDGEAAKVEDALALLSREKLAEEVSLGTLA